MIGEQREFPGELVNIESPYGEDDVARNIRYARACMRDSLLRKEVPIASHLLYTQDGILDDLVPAERAMGMQAGFRWNRYARASIVYTDLGVSPGMEEGIRKAHEEGREVLFRTIGMAWDVAQDYAYGLDRRQRRDLVYWALLGIERGECPCGYTMDPALGICGKCRTSWNTFRQPLTPP